MPKGRRRHGFCARAPPRRAQKRRGLCLRAGRSPPTRPATPRKTPWAPPLSRGGRPPSFVQTVGRLYASAFEGLPAPRATWTPPEACAAPAGAPRPLRRPPDAGLRATAVPSGRETPRAFAGRRPAAAAEPALRGEGLRPSRPDGRAVRFVATRPTLPRPHGGPRAPSRGRRSRSTRSWPAPARARRTRTRCPRRRNRR